MERQIETLTGPIWSGVRYFSTTRFNGYSSASWAGLNLGLHCADNEESVAKNRQLVRTILPTDPHWLQQVHGTQLYQALRPAAVSTDYTQAAIADAAWTTAPNVVLAILTADCLPVVIADTTGSIVGVAHAGWRGLASGVIERLFLRLEQQAGPAKQWQAWIGPAISQSCFEVGQEVFDACTNVDANAAEFFINKVQANKYEMDLAGFAAHKLSAISNNMTVTLSNACTFLEDTKYYSYRRKNVTGRQATFVWIDKTL